MPDDYLWDEIKKIIYFHHHKNQIRL